MNLAERPTGFRAVRDEPPPAPPVDRETFERWAERQEGRYEWVRGEIVMIVQVTRGHAAIAANIFGLLFNTIDRSVYQVSAAEFGVETRSGLRFPDVLVDRIRPNLGERSTDAPIFIAEVLSPSSMTLDMVEKAAEYTALATLRTYAVFSQDEPKVWVWQRGEAGFPEKPSLVEGRDARLEIPALSASLALAEIYRGIGAA